ncbi:MAG TPA: recombination mediator RecR [Desulfobacteria bacterium]|nr:recombination mediator RecR [Desulfobacteria bacterium]
MGIYPEPLVELVDQFSKLPGIGQKSATRMALFVLRSDPGLAEGLARSLMDVKEKIHFCSICFNLTDEDPCAICQNDQRADGTICVVETPGDQMALEESGVYRGRYHVLHGVLSPLDGIGPEDLKIDRLLVRLENEKIEEIILATNPTTGGETTASFISGLISEKNPGIRVSRIALGVPMGGDLKFMDTMTLQHALKRRVQIP